MRVSSQSEIILRSTAYERAYYGAILCERWAKANFEGGGPGHITLSWLEEAMKLYEEAEGLSPSGNDDAVLRWNSCTRFIERARLEPRAESVGAEAGFGDEPPPHHQGSGRRAGSR